MYQVCKKWRVIIIAMLVGAVLADVAAIALNVRRVSALKAQMEAAESQDQEETAIDTAKLRAALSEKEGREVEKAAASYIAYMKTSDAQLAYYCDSILMQMDPNKVPTMTLQYYIDNGYKAEYPVVASVDNAQDIGTALGNFASSGEVCKKIADKLGWSNDITYIQELISFEADKHTLTVKIIAPEEADCEKMGSVIKAEISQFVSNLQEVYGTFEAKLAMEECIVAASQELMTAQTAQLTNIYSTKSDFRTSVTSFNEEQKVYYEALIENSIGENVEPLDMISDGAEEDSEENALLNLKVEYINIKYILLGVIFGLILSVVWICIQYISSGFLMAKSDMKEGFGISVIGRVKIENMMNKNIIDRMIIRIFRSKGLQFTQNEQIQMTAAAIRIAAEKEGMKKLYVSSASDNKGTDQIKNDLVELLIKQGVNVMSGISIAYNPESLEDMSGCDGTVLVEGIGHSRYKDILIEKQLCEGSHVPIIGAVVVE